MNICQSANKTMRTSFYYKNILIVFFVFRDAHGNPLPTRHTFRMAAKEAETPSVTDFAKDGEKEAAVSD